MAQPIALDEKVPQDAPLWISRWAVARLGYDVLQQDDGFAQFLLLVVHVATECGKLIGQQIFVVVFSEGVPSAQALKTDCLRGLAGCCTTRIRVVQQDAGCRQS